MTLMQRIKVKSFLTFTLEEKQKLIKKIQTLRLHSLEEARVNKAGKMTKTQKKIRKKKGKSVPNSKAKALAALKKLAATDPEAFLKTIAMYE